MNIALYTLSYLFYSSELPLVFGGSDELNSRGYTDAALGNGPKGRSVIGNIEKLHPDAGAVRAELNRFLTQDIPKSNSTGSISIELLLI